MVILNLGIEVIYICCVSLLKNFLFSGLPYKNKNHSRCLMLLDFMYFYTTLKEMFSAMCLQWHYKYLRGNSEAVNEVACCKTR